MPSLTRLTAATLVLLPALAAAQQDKQQPNPLDPSRPVPQVSYQSVFERYQPARDEKETPEKRWIDINQKLMPQAKPAGQTPNTEGGHNHMHGGH
jgi:hypothetical protein